MPQNSSTPGRRGPLAALTFLFFMMGLLTCLNGILIPHFKEVFHLSYFQASLIQFSFFVAYFFLSLPAGGLLERFGYKTGLVVSLLVAAAGCLLLYPAAGMNSYAFCLLAIFILACGITILQVVANPYVDALGPPETAASRLNLAQAFNSLGTAIAPPLGSVTILALVGDKASASSIQLPYLVLAAILVALALLVFSFHLPPIENNQPAAGQDSAQRTASSIFGYPHLVLGVFGIFTYTGAEVSIGSYLVNLMELPEIAGLNSQTGGRYLALYWGGAMLGRFAGSYLLKLIKPNKLLACNALVNLILVVAAVTLGGRLAMVALLAAGFFNSIMFPTIFSLAIRDLGPLTAKGSGLVCMGIVGGALVPAFQGFLADQVGLLASFLVAAVCYLYILFYAAKGYAAKPTNPV